MIVVHGTLAGGVGAGEEFSGETSVLLGEAGSVAVLVRVDCSVMVDVGVPLEIAEVAAGGVYAAGVIVEGQPVMIAGFSEIYGAQRPIRYETPFVALSADWLQEERHP